MVALVRSLADALVWDNKACRNISKNYLKLCFKQSGFNNFIDADSLLFYYLRVACGFWGEFLY
jgi:hypothetical protein